MGNRLGFTLLEVMLSMAILAMLSLGVAAGLSTAIRAWESGERNLELYQQKRIVCDRLFKEIAGAINERGREEGSRHYEMIFNGEPDRLSFVTTAESIMRPGYPMGLKEEAIYVESGSGLMVHESTFSREEFFEHDRGTAYVLDPSVTDIAFRYYYLERPRRGNTELPETGEWLTTWGPEQIEIQESVEEMDDGTRLMNAEVKNRLPLAIEVTLTVMNERTESEETWPAFIIPLKEARVMGVSVKRRPRR